MKKYLAFFVFIPVVLMTSCATTVNNPTDTLMNEQQMIQLSTLIASTQFLKDHCQRSDIPELSVLTKTALLEADKKGWNTHQLPLAQLQQQTQSILNALNQDTTPLTEKCAYFNQSLISFINQAQQRQ